MNQAQSATEHANNLGARSSFGEQLKFWRKRRGLSQLHLAQSLGMSPRHLSFIETGRSRPGKAVVVRLSKALTIPLRETNQLMMAAGLAPIYEEQDHGQLSPFRDAVSSLIQKHDPYPAIVVNRWWDLVEANRCAQMMFQNFQPGDNLYEFLFLQDEMRSVVENWPEVAWASYQQLKDDVTLHSSDQRLQDLLQMVHNKMQNVDEPSPDAASGPAVMTRLNFNGMQLATTSMVARFNSPLDVHLSELKVELIFPADPTTEQFFKSLSGGVS